MVHGQDLGLIIAIVGSAIALISVMTLLFLWVRSEANADRRGLSDVLTKDRRDFIDIARGLESALNEIKLENKDFHFRILEIERNR